MAKKLFPDYAKLYLDGTDPDDADGASDQETQSECEGCLCRTVCGEKTEAMRRSVRSEVDFVLTFEEMSGIFDARPGRCECT